MGAEPLDASEVGLADVAGRVLGEVRQERSDSGVQRNDATLGLGCALLRRRGYEEVILSVVESEAGIPAIPGELLGHPQFSQHRVIHAVGRDCLGWNVASLLGSLPAPESQFVVLIGRKSRSQFSIAQLDC